MLINPPCRMPAEKHWAGYLPLGLGYIAASLVEAGHQVSVIDGKLAAMSLEDTVEMVVESKPDLIGISAMTAEFPLVTSLVGRMKAKWQAPILIGGPHCNAVGSDTLRECKALDFCCVGEGEQLFVELAECLKSGSGWEEIKGLSYRRDGEIISNVQRPYMENLDSLPFPAWGLFPQTTSMSILTHRGCPFQCIFCSHNSGSTPRYRSVANVLEELGQLVDQYSPKLIRFEDETFGLNLERTKAILQGIINSGLHLRASFHAQTRVDRIDDEFMTLYKAANFEMLELGVESGSDVILKKIRKGITIAQVEAAVMLARKHGVKIWCKFILGHPNETLETLRETVNFISVLNPDRVSVSIMTPYPGTPIYEMARKGECGYRLLSNSWNTFDKYSGTALELEQVGLMHLKWLQIWCFLRLYLVNQRPAELLTFALQHHIMAVQMVSGLLTEAATEVRLRISSPWKNHL